jgi:hypothetical protein
MMSNKPNASPQQQHQMRAQGEQEPSRDQIQERAYYRYVERGRADGQALDDWLVAEAEVRGRAEARPES